MNKDKYLYDLMVKNHSTIVGWFVHKGVVDRNDDELYIVNNIEEKTISPVFPKEDDYEVYKIYDNGVKRINAGIWDKAFAQIHLNYKLKDYSFKTLINAGFPIFDIGNTCDRYCFVHQIEEIICKFSDLVLDIYRKFNIELQSAAKIRLFLETTKKSAIFLMTHFPYFLNFLFVMQTKMIPQTSKFS